MMHYYLYQITNLINNKIYIGIHETTLLDDGYMGSGKLLHLAFTKYGINNFEKVILEYFGTRESMYSKEAEIVNAEFISTSDVYNITLGGHGGGWYHINSLPKDIRYDMCYSWYRNLTDEERLILNYKKVRCGINNGMYGSSRSGADNPMYGKHHSDASKKCNSESKLGKLNVRDAITGNIIGLIDKNHPNVLDKTWVSCSKDRIVSNEGKAKLKWWTNGLVECRNDTQPAADYYRGKLPNSSNYSTLGTKWWNNTKIQVRTKERPDETFILGRIK